MKLTGSLVYFEFNTMENTQSLHGTSTQNNGKNMHTKFVFVFENPYLKEVRQIVIIIIYIISSNFKYKI